MEWMILPLKRYAEFSGRSRRKEYWMWVLFTIIASMVLALLDGVLGLTLGEDDGTPTAAFTSTGVLGALFSLGTLIPNIAVSIRRLHDVNRTGWWILVPFGLAIVAGLLGGSLGGAAGGALAGAGAGVGAALLGFIIGTIVLLVFAVMEGTRGPNRFGADPKDPSGYANLDEVFR